MARITCLILLLLFAGCSAAHRTEESQGGSSSVTIEQIDELRSFDSLLPIGPDSVVALYRKYDRTTFNTEFHPKLVSVGLLIDSLNSFVPLVARIETLAIDHTFENFGSAARSGKSLYISGSYFFLFRDDAVLRSIIFHEFGHIRYSLLTESRRDSVAKVWDRMQSLALFYLFRDGEYSGNAKFGGHPDESPTELFASAFNLFHNRADELRARLRYVDQRHEELVRMLRLLVTGR